METLLFSLNHKIEFQKQYFLPIRFTSISSQNMIVFDKFPIYQVIERKFSFARPEIWFEFKFRQV